MMRTLNALIIVALVAMMALVAGCERKIVNELASNDQSLNGCFGCHGETSFDGALLQARGEWENSLHASGTSVDYTNRGGVGSDCQQCHNHQGFLDWIATGEEDTLMQSTVSSIHCFTCHAPHERGDLTLRVSAPYTLKNGVVFDHGEANLCANCHHSRTSLAADLGTGDSLTLNSRTGPHHGPQADMLQGTHGYQFAGYTYTSSPHATVVTNACIGCHMGDPQQHDGYNIGGHSFNMEFEAHDGTNYTLVGVCASCHNAAYGPQPPGQPAITKFDDWKDRDVDGDGTTEGIQTEFDGLADSLRVLLVKVIDPTTGLFKTKKIARLQAAAAYNFAIYREDRSRGIHNPNYFEGLLKSSIAYLNANPITLP